MLIAKLRRTNEALRRRILTWCLSGDTDWTNKHDGRHADLLNRLFGLPTFTPTTHNDTNEDMFPDDMKTDADGRLSAHVRHSLLSYFIRAQGVRGVMGASPATSTSTTDVLAQRTAEDSSGKVRREAEALLACLGWLDGKYTLAKNRSPMRQAIGWQGEGKRD
ncbi:hypothetical protein GY45DRAFT_1371159 [Cubamyces sp. BRFM 1775]|nr:hypothetical protein GY45DRAFT_1371159 [Cubamyces sp. BRFM 1775]